MSSAVSIGFAKKSNAPSAIDSKRVPALALSRHHHDRRLGIASAHVAQQLQPLLDLVGRRQPHIEQIEVGLGFAEHAAVGRVFARPTPRTDP